MRIDRERIIEDVADLAYVVGDVHSDGAGVHRLHQTFDICNAGNIDRVNSSIDLGIAEVDVMLRRYRPDSGVRDRLLERCVHEYLVARVLADWLAVTLPEAADIWRDKMAEVRGRIAATSSLCHALRRPLPPI